MWKQRPTNKEHPGRSPGYGMHHHGIRKGWNDYPFRKSDNRIYNARRQYHQNIRDDAEFRKLHKALHYSGPFIIIFYIIILILLFSWAGFKVLVIILAALLGIKGVFHLLFINRLEKQIFEPVAALENGFQEISEGHYQIHLESGVTNQLGQLINAFNEMAEKLWISEQTNQAYEENRKALIANISHDLKTPLTAVQGYIEMILDEDVTDTEHICKYLKIIQNNNTYMNKLIDDLFLFAKLDMDKVDFNLELVRSKAFMQDLMNEIGMELEEMKVLFSYVDQLGHDDQISIDGKRVCQAVRNVIGNAVRYGPDTGLEIHVSLYRQEQYLCLDMQDNGSGIAADKIEAIFDRFYRIDNERSKNFLSTGLGLAITRELMEAQGGKITVVSEENRGSCFTLWFPIAS